MSRQIVEIETKTFIRFWLVVLGIGLIIFFIIKASEALAIIGIAALLAIAIHPLAIKVDTIIGKKTQARLASVLASIYAGFLPMAAAVRFFPGRGPRAAHGPRHRAGADRLRRRVERHPADLLQGGRDGPCRGRHG